MFNNETYIEIKSEMESIYSLSRELIDSSEFQVTNIEEIEEDFKYLFEEVFMFFKKEFNKDNVKETFWWEDFFELLSLLYYNRSIIAFNSKQYYEAMEYVTEAAGLMPNNNDKAEYLESCDNIWRDARNSTKDGVAWTSFSLLDLNLNRNITFYDLCIRLVENIKNFDKVSLKSSAYRVLSSIDDSFFGKSSRYSDYVTINEALQHYKKVIQEYLNTPSEIEGVKMPYYWIVKENNNGEYPTCNIRSDQGHIIQITIQEIEYKDAVILR